MNNRQLTQANGIGFKEEWVASEAEARGAKAVFIAATEGHMARLTSLLALPHVLVATSTEEARRKEANGAPADVHVPFASITNLQVEQYVVTALVGTGHISSSDRLLIATYETTSELPCSIRDCCVMDLCVLPFDDDAHSSLNGIRPEILLSVLNLALEMGSDRSGRVGGTMFLVGDVENVLAHCEPFLFEPFHTYPKQSRRVADPTIQSTIVKYARLDGAFVVTGDGYLEKLVRKVNPPRHSPYVDLGLGSRHATACSITLDSSTVAMTVSESAGNVSVFARGRKVSSFAPRGRN